jgi:ABC-type transport system substrate-binding protein
MVLLAAFTPFAAAAAQGVAAQGDALQRAVIGVQLEPPILDPTISPAAAISECLYGNVYEGLVQFARDGSVLPSLAESWDISADGMTYVFHLRQDVRFHDGSRFDSAAAKFSLDRAMDAKSSNAQRSQLRAIRDVEALDPYTLRVSLHRRSGGLLQSLTLGAFVMVSPQSAGANAVNPVGTGPYRFAGWRRGDSLTLARNPDFRGPVLGLDEVTFKFIADPTAAFAALMAGDVDAFASYPAPESFAQFAADPRFAVSTGTTEMEVVLGLNERIAPLQDLRVRRAISYALDRHAIIDGAMFGYGTPIGSHFPPSNPAYVDLTGVYPHDVPKARALLEAAGYGRGLTLSLKLPPTSYARRSGEIIAAQLALVGIHVVIENLEWAHWLDQVYTRHAFDMSIVGHAEPLDYDIYAREGYYFGYANADFNALIAALDDTVDALERRELLGRIQRKLAEDAVNGFLFQYPRLSVWNKHLVGAGFDNVLGTIDMRHAHYSKGYAGRAAAGAKLGAEPRTALHALALTAAIGSIVVAVKLVRRLGAAYLARRVGVLAATLAAATVVVFAVVQVAPAT